MQFALTRLWALAVAIQLQTMHIEAMTFEKTAQSMMQFV